MKNSNNKLRRNGALLAACATLLPLASGLGFAQTTPQSATIGDLKISWEGKFTGGPKEAVWEGNVVVSNPDLYVAAQRAEFKRNGNQIQEVRAEKGVTFKVNLASPNAGEPARIEATSDVATLDPVRRKLTLRGSVDGWYEVPKAGRTKLRTEMVVLYYQGENLMADLTGNVRIDVPAEAASGLTSIGAVTVTSREASVDQAKGIARFTGNARAVSNEGVNKFDVSAPEFVLTRTTAGGTIDTLKTTGRTLVKLDMPPDPEASPTTAVATATTTEPPAKSAISRPTHVEASADSATVTRGNNTLVFEGNVKGFYELSPEAGKVERYNFSGTRAEITYVTAEAATAERVAGLHVQVMGAPAKPAQIDIPALDMGLKNKK